MTSVIFTSSQKLWAPCYAYCTGVHSGAQVLLLVSDQRSSYFPSSTQVMLYACAQLRAFWHSGLKMKWGQVHWH